MKEKGEIELGGIAIIDASIKSRKKKRNIGKTFLIRHKSLKPSMDGDDIV